MRKNLLQFTTLAIILLLGACSSDEIIEKNDNNPASQTGRTLSLTATMPDDNSDNRTTRVGLEQQEDNTIALVWEEIDELQLAFVQGDIKRKSIAKVKNITEGGKKAQFDIIIPDGIEEGVFDLYGVYGGGGLDNADPTKVILPTNPGEASSLASVKERKDVMLHFASNDVQTTNSQLSVVFNHLGSLFSITVKNTSTISLDNLAEARLVGPEGGNWAYNAAIGGKSYDLVTGQFQNPETAGNYISFKAEKSTVLYGESISFWGWYPPLPEAVWPELQLELRDETNTLITSINNKPARTEATAAGQSFYFYAAWDGAELNFSDEYFTPPLGDNEYWVMPMGTLGTKTLTEEQKETITTMIIRGEINKDDFEVLKRQMPLLTHVDLSAVRCEDNKIPGYAIGDFYTPNKTITTIILPKSITRIEEGAFFKCAKLTGTLNLPPRLESLGKCAFEDCKNLTGSLIIPNTVISIENQAFQYCSGFESLTLSNMVSTIGYRAFRNCTGLTGKVTIPETLISIGDGGFYGCNNIATFRFPHLTPFTYEYYMLPAGVSLEVPASAKATYKATDLWKDHPILGYFPMDGGLPDM